MHECSRAQTVHRRESLQRILQPRTGASVLFERKDRLRLQELSPAREWSSLDQPIWSSSGLVRFDSSERAISSYAYFAFQYAGRSSLADLQQLWRRVITKMEHWRESDFQKIRSMLSKMRMGCSVFHQHVFRRLPRLRDRFES